MQNGWAKPPRSQWKAIEMVERSELKWGHAMVWINSVPSQQNPTVEAEALRLAALVGVLAQARWRS
jgi:hypothetical protein